MKPKDWQWMLGEARARLRLLKERYGDLCAGNDGMGNAISPDTAKVARSRVRRDMCICALTVRLLKDGKGSPEELSPMEEDGFAFLINPVERHLRLRKGRGK